MDQNDVGSEWKIRVKFKCCECKNVQVGRRLNRQDQKKKDIRGSLKYKIQNERERIGVVQVSNKEKLKGDVKGKKGYYECR